MLPEESQITESVLAGSGTHLSYPVLVPPLPCSTSVLSILQSLHSDLCGTVVSKARQTRFIVSHQPISQFGCEQVVIIHYSLLANAICTRQVYGAMAIKSGCVTAWKAIMTVEAAGLGGSGC